MRERESVVRKLLLCCEEMGEQIDLAGALSFGQLAMLD